MKKISKIVSIMLSVCMIVSMMCTIVASAAEPTASLAAAICGNTHDFRASQLLEVKTEGFSDNAKLEYTYNRSEFYMQGILGAGEKTKVYPYFFTFDSDDMYTANEMKNGSGTAQPIDLVTENKYFALSAICWYNGNYYLMTKDDMAGMTLYITVKDTNEESATYGKTATVSYTGFGEPNLTTDIHHVAVAVFEGETVDILDALGHAGVTHITCENATVESAETENHSVARATVYDGVYKVTGVTSGMTHMDLTISKNFECIMHSGQSATAKVDIRTFKKPVPTPSATTITLSNIEAGVSYTIDSVTQICTDENVPLVFENLTPETDYEIYVSAQHSFVEEGETFSHEAHATVLTRTLALDDNVHYVYYDTDGGVPVPETAVVEDGGNHYVYQAPRKTGYIFLGWQDSYGNMYNPQDMIADINSDIYLKALWHQLPEYKNNYAYIFGYSDTVMGAEGPLLRSEASAMLHRLVKQNNKLGGFVYNEADTPDFNDIGGEWFRSGIEFMNYKGAFATPEGGSVQPYAKLTRGEAFKLICLGLGFTEDTTLTNEEYAVFLYNAGYIEGDEEGNLNADRAITRAEFCTAYNRIIGREDALLIDSEGNAIIHETYGFTDLDPSKWYYENMLRATSAYDENGYVSLELRGVRNVLDDFAG